MPADDIRPSMSVSVLFSGPGGPAQGSYAVQLESSTAGRRDPAESVTLAKVEVDV